MASSNAEQLIGLLSDLDKLGARRSSSFNIQDLLDRTSRMQMNPGEFGKTKLDMGGGGPSVLSRVFDVLSRPLYAVAEPIRGSLSGDYAEDGSGYLGPLKGFWEGLSGQKKTRGSDVLISLDQAFTGKSREDATKDFESQNGFTKFAASLGSDIALDPLTYVNPFSIASKFKAPKAAAEEFKGVMNPGIDDVASQFQKTSSNPVQQSITDRAAGIKLPNFREMALNKPINFNQGIKMPDGRVIPFAGTGNPVGRLNQRNVQAGLVNPLREANMANAGVPGPEWFRQTVERPPTQREMFEQDIPAAFRGTGVKYEPIDTDAFTLEQHIRFADKSVSPEQAAKDAAGLQRQIDATRKFQGDKAAQDIIDGFLHQSKQIASRLSEKEAAQRAINAGVDVKTIKGYSPELYPPRAPWTDADAPREARQPNMLGPRPTETPDLIPGMRVPSEGQYPPAFPEDIGEEIAQQAGYKNLSSAQKSGADQAARRDARVAANENAARTALGFNSWKMSRDTGMPYPQAMRIVEEIANGTRPAQVAAGTATDPVVRELPKLADRGPGGAIVDRVSGDLIDDIAKGGKTRPNGAKYRDEYGMREQANVYNTAVTALTKSGQFRKSQIPQEAFNILVHVEAKLKEAGFEPLYRAGKGAPAHNLSLPDLIDELGGINKVNGEHLTQVMDAFKRGKMQNIKDPEVAEAITRLMERNAAAAVPHVKAAEATARALSSIADQVIPPGKMAKWQEKTFGTRLIPSMKANGAPVTATSAAQKVLDDIKAASKPARERVSPEAKKQMQLAVERGTFGPKSAIVTESQTRDLEKALEVQFKTLGEQVQLAPQGVVGTFLARIASHYGARDVRPYYLSESQKGIWQTGQKERYLNNIVKNYSKAEINEAWTHVQGMGTATTPRAQELANEFNNIMHQLVNPQGVNSVAKSAVALQKDLNKALARLGSTFRFTKKKSVKDALGKEHDFSQKSDWLDSWKVHQTDNPAEFIAKLDRALEQVTHEYTFWDEAAARWGSRKFGGEYRYKTSVERLNGYYFPEAIAKQLETMQKTMNEVYTSGSEFGRKFDNIMGAVKSGMTIYNPSHHIRNMIGDVFNSYIAGVTSPKPYLIAKRVLGSERHRYEEFQGLKSITDEDELRRMLTKPGDIVVRNRSGQGFTANQIYLGAADRGLLQTAHTSEDIMGRQITPMVLGGQVQKRARAASEWRDHEARLAHFIDIVNKSHGTDINKIFENAAQTVRKWHPDGLDMTAFERKYMRRLFPFYSWTRKAIPLMVEAAIKQPGRVMMYPKTMLALQEGAGIDGNGIGNPFPSDMLAPEWLKAKGIGPIANGASGGPLGLLNAMGSNDPGTADYTVLNPSNPFQDLVSQFGGMGNATDPFKGAWGMANPFIKVPIEVGFDKEAQTGQPIKGREADYFSKQIPLASVFARLTNMNITGSPTARGEKQGFGNGQDFWNWLTAMGITGTGPLQKNAQIEQSLKGNR